MDKFTVVLPREEAAQRIAVVERFTGNPTTLPAVAGVQILVEKKGVTLRATNLEEFVEASVPAKVEGEGSVVVPGAVFSQVVSTSKGEHITLSLKDGVLQVGEAKLRALASEDFPSPPSLQTKQREREIEGEALMSMFEATLPAVATSTIKPELTGIYCNLDETQGLAAATDSFRLAEKRVPLEKGDPIEGIIIPRRSAASVLRLLNKKSSATIHTDGKQCRFSFDGFVYTTRLIEGTFPDYERIVPTTFATKVVVEKEVFAYALKRTAIFSDQFSYVRLTVDPSGGVIRLFASNQQVGEVQEEVAAAVEGEPQEVGFNLRYLQEGLPPIAAQRVILQFVGGNKPLVITGEGDSSYRYLTMPMNR
ncbi:MAG: DNA polymerase III subunit beta [Candidatus Parcubacteria bacterium]|nr:MAG: DNA polymerase III subunit beta [Candidatus Parcubacteria bacterium]